MPAHPRPLSDRCTNNADADVSFLAKCIVAVAISRLEDHALNDDRWSGLIQRGLNSQSRFAHYRGQHDSVKLWNLVQIAREPNSAHSDYDDPSARTIFHNTMSVAHQLHVEPAPARALRAVESARGLDAGPAAEPGPAVERDANSFLHVAPLRPFA
jgi:hypothetical protein